MPLLTVCYLAAYIDRQNVAYAKLQMLDSLHLSEVAYGFGTFIAQNAMPCVQHTTGSTAAPMLVPAARLFVFGIGAVIAARTFSGRGEAAR